MKIKNLSFLLITFIVTILSSKAYTQNTVDAPKHVMPKEKEFTFDYIIEFGNNYEVNNQNKISTYYYMTNSKNNEYIVQIFEKDSLNLTFDLIINSRLISAITVLKADFAKSESIGIPCKFYDTSVLISEYKTVPKYKFQVLNDTIINNQTYGLYKSVSLNPKREKRKKLSSEYYIIDKTTDFHKPLLNQFIFYEREQLKMLPNGLPVNRYLKAYDGEITREIKMVEYKKINKKIILLEDCD